MQLILYIGATVYSNSAKMSEAAEHVDIFGFPRLFLLMSNLILLPSLSVVDAVDPLLLMLLLIPLLLLDC